MSGENLTGSDVQSRKENSAFDVRLMCLNACRVTTTSLVDSMRMSCDKRGANREQTLRRDR
jgi:hypothetical protein